MKIAYLYSFLFTVICFSSCRKNDNARIPALTRVPTPLITKDASADLGISAQNPELFSAKFIVDLYFKTDVPPKKMDAVVIKNGDKTNVITLQTDITTYPTTIAITGPQLEQLFGAPIVVGDRFEIGANVTTQAGQEFLAFPPTGVAYGSGVANQIGASTSVRYEAVCSFDATVFNGDFEVIQDDWEDYAPGTVIPVTMINDHQISFEYAADDPKPIILDINLATNEVTIAKQSYGSYGGDEYFAESIAGASSVVSPCEETVSVRIHHSTAAGSADGTIVLKKKS
jgi:hypothetical protein